MRRLAAASGILLLIATFVADAARAATISDFRVEIENSTLAARFDLLDAFEEELIERIQTGLPSGFDFEFRLLRDTRFFYPFGAREVESARFQVVAMYNAVTREYLVNYKQNGKLVESKVVAELPELREAMTRFDGIPVFNLSETKTKRRLWVKARAELGSRNLFSLIPTKLKTDWVESEKFRLPRLEQ